MTDRQRLFLIVLTLVLVLGIPLVRSSLFIVNEQQLAVVLRFGQPVATYMDPGLRAKLPLIDSVRRLPKPLQFWLADSNEVLVDLPTADGKKIEVTPWAVWRIADPQRFLEVLVTMDTADQRVQTVVRGEVRDVITSSRLSEVVRSTDRKLTYSIQGTQPVAESPAPGAAPSPADPLAIPIPSPAQPGADERVRKGREKIVAEIQQRVQQRLAPSDGDDQSNLGIELVDAGISRIEFVPQVREAAFKRLIAFMDSIAAQYISEGEQKKTEMLNRTDEEVQGIMGAGKQQASITRGKVDAEIIESYAKAIEETGDFYNFIRTLEAYEEIFQGNTRMILTTKSPLLKLLRDGVETPKK